jgi:hypothetical protein
MYFVHHLLIERARRLVNTWRVHKYNLRRRMFARFLYFNHTPDTRSRRLRLAGNNSDFLACQRV